MKIKIKSADQFSRLLDALANETVTACIHFKLYSDLEAARPDYSDEFNQSWTFWSLTFQAHWDATVFRLCKIYDQHKTSLNLQNFLDTIEENISIFDEVNFRDRLKGNPFVDSLAANAEKPDLVQLQKDKEFVSIANPLVENLVFWRHNFFAHRSSKHVAANKSLADHCTFDMTAADQLLKQAMRIVNNYSSLFWASSYSTQIVGHDDYNYVLETIHKDIQRREEQIISELARFEKNKSQT